MARPPLITNYAMRAVIGLALLTLLMTMYERLVYPGSW